MTHTCQANGCTSSLNRHISRSERIWIMNIYLHIGLHKTATTFLQQHVFKVLNCKNINFNPPEIMSLMESIFVYNIGDENNILKAKAIVECSMNEPCAKDMFISCERMSQLFFTHNYEESSSIVKRIFPKAKILLFLRFQPDWLLSCYKQSLHSGDCQDVEDFLNYKNGKFETVGGNYNDKGLLHTDVHRADYYVLIKAYIEKYGRENLYIYFFEEFQKNSKGIVDEICSILKVPNKTKDYNAVRNRSYSSLACKLSIYRFNLFKMFGLHKFLPTAKKLRKKLCMHSSSTITWEHAKQREYFWSLVRIFFGKVYGRFIRSLTWRFFIQNCFDKIIYIDSDILEKNKMRQKLEKLYRLKNQRLLKYISKDKIPKIYLNS